MSFLDSFNKFTNDINNKLNGELQKTGLGGISSSGQDGTNGLGVSGLGAINADKSQEIDMGGELGNLSPKYGFTPDMVFDEQGHFKHKQNPSGNGVVGGNVENPGQFGGSVKNVGNVGVETMGQTFENPMNHSENYQNTGFIPDNQNSANPVNFVENPVTQPQSGVNLKKSQEPIQNPVTPVTPDNSQIQNNGDTFDDWYNQ